MRNQLQYLGTVILIAAILSACDSTDEGRSDSELILGDWRVTEVADTQGNQTASLDSLGTLTVEFVNNQYTIRFDALSDDQDRTETGGYTLDPIQKVVLLQFSILGQTIPVPFNYVFRGEDTLELSITDSGIINAVLETDYEGRVMLTLQRR